eukprot:14880442-Alexandrium_andersonii.AAC.1
MELLEPKYIVQCIELDAKAQGWPVNRVRCYRILTHKSKVLEVTAPLADIMPCFARDCDITWASLMLAETSEVEAELEWARFRRGVTGNVMPELLEIFGRDAKRVLSCLTHNEQ